MTRFKKLDTTEMSQAQRNVAAAIAAGPRGGLRGPFISLLHSPELADRLQKVGEYLRFEGVVPRRLNELAILLTARANHCQYEWHAHAPQAEKAGLDAELIAAIAAGGRPDAMQADEQAVYAFCVELHERRDVSDTSFAAVVALLGETGTIDLIALCGYYTLLAMVLNTAEPPPPSGAAPPLR